jgi:hypothetical protein
MSTSRHTDELSERKSKSKSTSSEEPVLTPRQLQKQDASDLAELIYDIFKDGLSSVTIVIDSRMDDKHV